MSDEEKSSSSGSDRSGSGSEGSGGSEGSEENDESEGEDEGDDAGLPGQGFAPKKEEPSISEVMEAINKEDLRHVVNDADMPMDREDQGSVSPPTLQPRQRILGPPSKTHLFYVG
jgi:hypothetical protein